VLVVAVLQICFGSLALLGNLCNGGLQLAGGNKAFVPAGSPQAAQQPDVEGMMRARMPHYELMIYGGEALGLIAGTVMVVSGVGLIKMRRWARWLTIGYACYNVASTIIGFIFALTFSLPLTREILAQARADPKLPPQGAFILNMTETITTAALYATLLFLAYPIALLIVMFRPHVRAAFRAEGGAAVEEDEGEEASGLPDEGDEADTPREQEGDSGAIKNPDAPAP
jgi:hypothetical protein